MGTLEHLAHPGAEIAVRVTPRASRNAVVIEGGAIRVCDRRPRGRQGERCGAQAHWLQSLAWRSHGWFWCAARPHATRSSASKTRGNRSFGRISAGHGKA